MAKGHQSFGKKEREKKKEQRRKDKELKKEMRKAGSTEKKSLDDMIAYVDENGNISSTPPQPSKKHEVRAETIEVGVRRLEKLPKDARRSGKVKFFDEGKGFGFIEDNESGDSIFVHVTDLDHPIKENDIVTFQTKRGPKGPMAFSVELVTE